MITFNPLNSKLILGDYIPSSEFENAIFDGGGYSTERNQFVELNCEDHRIVVFYDLYLIGKITYHNGDQYTPNSVDVDINTADIKINSIEIDDYPVEMDKKISETFEKIVKKLI